MEYTINKYTYKSGHIQMEIYARKRETADKIVSICNTESSFIWKRKLFGFIKKTKVDVPPLELEEEQITCAEKELENLRKRRREGKIKVNINELKKKFKGYQFFEQGYENSIPFTQLDGITEESEIAGYKIIDEPTEVKTVSLKGKKGRTTTYKGKVFVWYKKR